MKMIGDNKQDWLNSVQKAFDENKKDLARLKKGNLKTKDLQIIEDNLRCAALARFSDKELEIIENLGGKMELRQISSYMGFHYPYFLEMLQKDERVYESYERGRSKVVSYVVDKLMDKIEEGSLMAIKYYLDNLGGWIKTYGANSDTLVQEPLKVSVEFLGTTGDRVDPEMPAMRTVEPEEVINTTEGV